MDYRSAGVDVEAGYKSVELIKNITAAARRAEVVGGLGGFGALFSIAKAKEMEEPLLVSGTDGVGTKLKIAILMDKHDTIGIDCVAMCVNDIVCGGAEPLFFLDYISCGKNNPEKIASIVKGMTDGCVQAGCALVGGETAEMPGFYTDDEYDVAGFAVGLVDKKKVIDGSAMREGDVIIGLASSGLHSNGYSLVRKALRVSENNLCENVTSLGCALGEELLRPTKIYVKPILELCGNIRLKGVANITGGGFIENIPRMMPKGLKAFINCGTWPVLPVFDILKQAGGVSDRDMFNTFNMGIGMVVAVDPGDADKALALLKASGESPYIIGEAVKGEGIEICYE